jgi:hypothetical protein
MLEVELGRNDLAEPFEDETLPWFSNISGYTPTETDLTAPHDGFDEDELCELFTQRQARVADLANKVVPVRHEPDHLVFAQTDFPQAILHFRRGAQSPDPHRHPRLHPAQRTQLAVGFLPRVQTGCHIQTHAVDFNIAAMDVLYQPFIAHCWT